MGLFHLHLEVLDALTGYVKGSNSLTQDRVTSSGEISSGEISSEFRVPLPRVQLGPAPPVPDASSLSLSLFSDGPAGSGFAPGKSKKLHSWKLGRPQHGHCAYYPRETTFPG